MSCESLSTRLPASVGTRRMHYGLPGLPWRASNNLRAAPPDSKTGATALTEVSIEQAARPGISAALVFHVRVLTPFPALNPAYDSSGHGFTLSRRNQYGPPSARQQDSAHFNTHRGGRRPPCGEQRRTAHHRDRGRPHHRAAGGDAEGEAPRLPAITTRPTPRRG